MLTGFQQFLATCIGNTEEETDPSVSDTQQSDEHQTESEFATDDNSTNDAESAASDISDTPISEPSEIENADALSESEETPSEDDGSPFVADDDSPQIQSDSEVLPISIDEEAHASKDDLPNTPSAEETSVVEIATLAPSDDEATESSEDTDPISEDESGQENEGAIAQHAQISDVEADRGEVTSPLPQETDRSDDTEAEQKKKRR